MDCNKSKRVKKFLKFVKKVSNTHIMCVHFDEFIIDNYISKKNLKKKKKMVFPNPNLCEKRFLDAFCNT